MNLLDKYLGQKSFHSKVNAQVDRHTHRTDCSTWKLFSRRWKWCQCPWMRDGGTVMRSSLSSRWRGRWWTTHID